MESNIFHYCKNCKKIIITELNIYNRLGRMNNLTMKNGDLKIFDNKTQFDENLANYFIKNKTIFCKNCNVEVGYINKPFGVISIHAIESKQVSFHRTNDEKNKVRVYVKNEIDLHVLAKKVKMLLENLKIFLRDFYLNFYVPIAQLMEEIKEKKNNLYNIISNKDYLCLSFYKYLFLNNIILIKTFYSITF
jgi:hypothetical protein